MAQRASRSRRREKLPRSTMLARLGFVKRRKRSAPARKAKRKRAGSRIGLQDRLARLAPSQWNFSLGYRRIMPALAAAVAVALGMAVLRIDLIRSRYEIGVNFSTELRLNDDIALLTARMRELRDPLTLSRRADELGFVPPQQLIDLPLQTAPPAPWATAKRLARLASGRSDQP